MATIELCDICGANSKGVLHDIIITNMQFLDKRKGKNEDKTSGMTEVERRMYVYFESNIEEDKEKERYEIEICSSCAKKMIKNLNKTTTMYKKQNKEVEEILKGIL